MFHQVSMIRAVWLYPAGADRFAACAHTFPLSSAARSAGSAGSNSRTGWGGSDTRWLPMPYDRMAPVPQLD